MLFIALNFIICNFFCSTFAFLQVLRDSDDALINLVRGPAEFEQFCQRERVTDKQSKEILAQYYSTHAGILYYLRQNWHCAEMDKERIELRDNADAQSKCDYFRECLDILYEFLFNMHAGHPTEKPTFHHSFTHMWGGTLVDANKALFRHWKFYFHPELMKEKERTMKLDPIFNIISNNSFKSQIQKFFDQFLGRTTVAAAGDGNELGRRFNEMMEKMLQKTEARAIGAKNVANLVSTANVPSTSMTNVPSTSMTNVPSTSMTNVPSTSMTNVPSTSMTNVPSTSMENALAFSSSSSKKAAALLLDTLLNMTPIYYLFDAQNDDAFLFFVKNDDLKEFKPTRPDYYHGGKTLGVLHLLRKEWHCANAERNQFFDETQCDKFRLYLDILYEYLFRLHYGFTAGKQRPIFQGWHRIDTLIGAVRTLDEIRMFYFGETKYDQVQFSPYCRQKTIERWPYLNSLNLLNEEELDYLKKDVMPPQETLVEIAHGQNDERNINAQTFQDLLRQFDQKLEHLVHEYYQSLEWYFTSPRGPIGRA